MSLNLKEAFRYQNKLKGVMETMLHVLDNEDNVTTTKTTMLLKKVNPEAENEMVTSERSLVFAQDINKTVAFVEFLMNEREKLAQAISAAKKNADIDIDTETGLNNARRQFARTMRDMAGIQSSSASIKGGGTGYKFNADGEQVSYRCDIERVTTIDFDRNAVKALASTLAKKADEISTKVDVALINIEVAYEPPFDANDDIAVIYEDFEPKN